MEPISATMTFATIVSLLADFVAHQDSEDAKDFDSFMTWLSEQRHEEIRDLLNSNTVTIIGIKAILNESRQTILDRLSSLDKTLAGVASSIGPYRDIAQAAQPNIQLSAQAISVLEQFYDSGASSILASKRIAGTVILTFLDGKSGHIEYTEPRFIEDDLNTLVELGLFDLDFNKSGDKIYKFKRTAAALVDQRRRV